jgi:hypothetical protein
MPEKMKCTLVGLLSGSLWCAVLAYGQDGNPPPVFSGPQAGERLPPLPAEYVFDDQAGQQVDIVEQAAGGPVLVVFVHELTRPSVALTRTVMEYAADRAESGLLSVVVFLGDDATALRSRLKRARHALPKRVTIAISTAGREGPGAYGLNRQVTLTVLAGKGNRVTANFALVQPSVAADAPRIGAAIADLIGQESHPTLADMDSGAGGRSRMDVPDFRRLLAPVIRQGADPAEVDRAAAAVETRARQDRAFRQRLGQAARRIAESGQLHRYGTPRAQEYLQQWAQRLGPDARRQDAAEMPSELP